MPKPVSITIGCAMLVCSLFVGHRAVNENRLDLLTLTSCGLLAVGAGIAIGKPFGENK